MITKGTNLTKGRLLLGAVNATQITDPVLAVKLDVDLLVETGFPVIQPAGLDDNHSGHDVELGEEAGAAVGAEEVAVVLTRGTGNIVVLWGS